MRSKTILAIILALLVLLLALIVGARVGLIQHETAMHTLAVSTEAAASIAPSHRPVDEVDVTPPAPKNTPLPPTPEPTPEPTEEPKAAVLAYEQPIVGQPENGRYGSLLLTADEIETIARLVRLEAGGESFSGQQAVVEVILNRVVSRLYPDNVYDVVYQSGQFTPASSIPYTAATQTQYDAVDAALRGPNILPTDVLYFATGMNGRSSAWGWIGGHCFCY